MAHRHLDASHRDLRHLDLQVARAYHSWVLLPVGVGFLLVIFCSHWPLPPISSQSFCRIGSSEALTADCRHGNTDTGNQQHAHHFVEPARCPNLTQVSEADGESRHGTDDGQSANSESSPAKRRRDSQASN